jgi:hypothetical protein
MTTSSRGPKENDDDDDEEDGCQRIVQGAMTVDLELGPGKKGIVTNLLDCFTNLPNSHGCRAGVSVAREIATVGRKRRLRRRRLIMLMIVLWE